MDIFLGIVIGAAVVLLVASAAQLLKTERLYDPVEVTDENGETKTKKKWLPDVGKSWINAGIAGFVVGGIAIFAPMAAKNAEFAGWLPPFFLGIMAVMFLFLGAWWVLGDGTKDSGGGHFIEMIPFILLGVLFFLVANTAAYATKAVIANAFWGTVWVTLPAVILTALVGFLMADWLLFRSKVDVISGSGEATRDKAAGISSAIAAGVIAIALLVTGIAWGNPAMKQAGADEGNGGSPWHYYHYDVGGTYFGPADTSANAEASFDELYGRMEKDNALGVAILIYTDLNLGTDFTQENYFPMDAHPEEGMLTWANSRIGHYSDHLDEYKEAIQRWYRFTMNNSTRKAEYRTGLKDQMYMYDYGDGDTAKAPKLVILETDQPDGDILFIDYNIKDNEKSLALRRNCGFQPTDVSELFGEPTTGVGTTPGGGGPGINPGNGPNGDPNANPDSDPKSDPQTNPGDKPDGYGKGPENGPDVKPGEPDQNTNNPEDPDHSIVDRPDNSTSYPDYESHQDWMDNLEEINDNQQVGGDPNTPSTPTPPDTTVDSNAENGTGYGGIDTPTPISESAQPEDGSAATKSGGDGAWGGGKQPE